MIAIRRGTIPAAEPGTFDLGKARVPVAVRRGDRLHAGVRRADLPAAVRRQRLGVPRPVVLAALWAVTGLRKRLATGEAGPDYAKTHIS